MPVSVPAVDTPAVPMYVVDSCVTSLEDAQWWIQDKQNNRTSDPIPPIVGYIVISDSRVLRYYHIEHYDDLSNIEDAETHRDPVFMTIGFREYSDGKFGITHITTDRRTQYSDTDDESYVDMINLYGPHCILRKAGVYATHIFADPNYGLSGAPAPAWNDDTSQLVKYFTTNICAILARAEQRASS
jgi:hypothetical protein